MAFDLSEYNTVPERIAEFREKFPDGRLQPLDPHRPYRIEEVGGKLFVVFVAAAYRSPDDHFPGIGCAWEPFPGKTTFTADSELMNAETSAWGRALVAALVADTKKGVSSADEIRARLDEEAAKKTTPAKKAPRIKMPPPPEEPTLKPAHAIIEAVKAAGLSTTADMSDEKKKEIDEARRDVLEEATGFRSITELKDDPELIKKALLIYTQLKNGDRTLHYTETGKAYTQEEPF